MLTGNTPLLDPSTNKEYYSKSDGSFMPIEKMTYAHDVLSRARWARDKVYELKSENHLDIGCKDAYLCMTLISEGIDCVGVDPSEDAILEAKLRASQQDIDVELYVGYGETFEINEYFDTVTCMEVLEHVVDPDALLTNLCKLGRYLLITTPDREGRFGMKDSKRNPEHVRVYDETELREFGEKYGVILELVNIDDELHIMIDTNGD